MDIQELKQFESVYQPSKEIDFCWLRKQYVQLSTEENHAEVVDHANDSLRIWQAAKAQAVSDGFVLVERFKLLQILGSAVAINTNLKTKINLLESDFIIGELKAMIKAQESTNEEITIRCTNCGLEFESDYDLEQNLIDPETGEIHDGCPTCKTDAYLMDLIKYPDLEPDND